MLSLPPIEKLDILLDFPLQSRFSPSTETSPIGAVGDLPQETVPHLPAATLYDAPRRPQRPPLPPLLPSPHAAADEPHLSAPLPNNRSCSNPEPSPCTDDRPRRPLPAVPKSRSASGSGLIPVIDAFTAYQMRSLPARMLPAPPAGTLSAPLLHSDPSSDTTVSTESQALTDTTQPSSIDVPDCRPLHVSKTGGTEDTVSLRSACVSPSIKAASLLSSPVIASKGTRTLPPIVVRLPRKYQPIIETKPMSSSPVEIDTAEAPEVAQGVVAAAMRPIRSQSSASFADRSASTTHHRPTAERRRERRVRLLPAMQVKVRAARSSPNRARPAKSSTPLPLPALALPVVREPPITIQRDLSSSNLAKLPADTTDLREQDSRKLQRPMDVVKRGYSNSEIAAWLGAQRL